MSQKTKSLLRITTLVLFGFFILVNFSYLPVNNLHPDEAYYWEWSRGLDIGYFDNSPGVAYVIRLFTMIGGNNELWVRMPAFLTWMFIMISAFAFARKIYKDETTGYLAMLLAIFTPLMLTGSHIMTHDIPLILFSIPTWYFLYLAIEKEQKNAWYGVGVFFGLALFSKFQAWMIAFSIVMMLLVRPDKRRFFLKKEPYLAIAIGLLCFAPVFYWNWQHQWAAFAWQSQHGIHTSVSLQNLGEFLTREIGVYSLLLLSLIYYTVKLLLKPGKIEGNDRFLLGCFLPVFLFFSCTSLTFPAEANWPAVAFFPSLIFLARRFRVAFQKPGRLKNTLFGIFIGFSLTLSGLLISLARYPGFFIQTLGIQLPASWVITNSTYGWAGLGRQIDNIILQTTGEQKNPVPVFADSYQLAAELDFYISRPVNVFTTREAHRNHFEYLTMKRIHSFNRQPGLLVLEKDLPASAKRYFSGIHLESVINTYRYKAIIRTIHVYRFTGLNASALYKMAEEKPLGYPGTYSD